MCELTTQECKRLLSKLGWKLGVSPKLIAERLLSEDDKSDLRRGALPNDALECHITAWIDSGLADYAHGNPTPLVINYRGV